MANELQIRFYNFLSVHTPFNFVSKPDLLEVCEKINMRYVTKDEVIFHEGGTTGHVFYVVNKGLIELFQTIENEKKIFELCDEGDSFGVIAMFAKTPYRLSAKATEDSLLLEVPWNIFSKLIERNSKLALFFASGFATGIQSIRSSIQDSDNARRHFTAEHNKIHSTTFKNEDIFEIDPKKDVLTCSPDVTIKEVAEMMTKKRIGSIIVVDDNKMPLGIVTNVDFRKKIGTGLFLISEKISKLMTPDVVTVRDGLNVSTLIVQMMKRNIRHLCVTEDGTPLTPIKGIVSEHDILLLYGNNPAVLLKEILQSKDTKNLPSIRNRAEELIKQYIHQEVSISFITDIISEINDAIIQRAIHSAETVLGERGLIRPPLRFTWLSLGSEGRSEQLLRTDQDNAIIYEDPDDSMKEIAHEYFLNLGKFVCDTLNECGFEYCPGEIMASNPKYCLPVSEWKKLFAGWIEIPEEEALMHTAIFFDFRSVYGDKHLADDLEKFIHDVVQRNSLFLPFLANNALKNPPPLSFFRSMILEHTGEHKNQFDIKARAMMPLADAARVLALQYNYLEETNTQKRFLKAAEIDVTNEQLYKETAMVYEILIRTRTKNGLEHNDSGRYIDPAHLNKLERQIFRSAFQTIEEIQKVLKVRFQLSYLR